MAGVKRLENDIIIISEEIERISKEDAACQRLRQIPGIGPLVSTATVAAIGNGAAFSKGREFAAWLGSYRDNTRPAATQSCMASASEATSTCAVCSSMALVPSC